MDKKREDLRDVVDFNRLIEYRNSLWIEWKKQIVLISKRKEKYKGFHL